MCVYPHTDTHGVPVHIGMSVQVCVRIGGL